MDFVYVDDLIIIGDNPQVIEEIIAIICAEFRCCDLGLLESFLEIEVTIQHDGSVMLTQARYAMDLLIKYNMAMFKPCQSPTISGSKLKNYEGSSLDDPTSLRMLVGSLQYLTLTRPDLTYQVNQISQFMQNPRPVHMTVVKRILRYVKGP